METEMQSEENREGIFWKWFGFPRWLRSQESACQCRRCKRRGLDFSVRKIPWRRKWQPTPVFLPGKSHGQRSLVGYCPWGHKGSDMTEQLNSNNNKNDLLNFFLKIETSLQHLTGFLLIWWAGNKPSLSPQRHFFVI